METNTPKTFRPSRPATKAAYPRRLERRDNGSWTSSSPPQPLRVPPRTRMYVRAPCLRAAARATLGIWNFTKAETLAPQPRKPSLAARTLPKAS